MTTIERYKSQTYLKLRGCLVTLDHWKPNITKEKNLLVMISENT